MVSPVSDLNNYLRQQGQTINHAVHTCHFFYKFLPLNKNSGFHFPLLANNAFHCWQLSKQDQISTPLDKIKCAILTTMSSLLPLTTMHGLCPHRISICSVWKLFVAKFLVSSVLERFVASTRGKKWHHFSLRCKNKFNGSVRACKQRENYPRLLSPHSDIIHSASWERMWLVRKV